MTAAGPGAPTRVRMTGEQRRAQLVVVGRGAFARHGYDATTVEEIAALAGVSKPVVYEHFGGKDGLYREVVEQAFEHLLTEMSRSLTAEDPRDLVEQAALTLLTFVEERTEEFCVLTRDAPFGADGATGLSSLLSEVAARVEHIVAEQFDRAGFDTAAAPVLARALVGMVALTGQWWLDVRRPSREQVAAQLVNLAWNGLSGLQHSPTLRSS